MLISVILSNYNGARYLAEAIESVIKQQDFDDYEFVIVDDGSTDESAEIIRKYGERHPALIKLVLNEINQGQAAGFNIGFEHARGELIAFMDSDDVWYPDKLKNLAEFYRQNKSGNNALYQHNMNRMQIDKITPSKFHWVLNTGDLFSQARSSRSIPHFSPTSGLAFPRWVLEKVMPIPLDFRICADGYLTRTTFCYGEVASTNQCWAAYRIHDANNTFQNEEFDNRMYANGLLIPMLNKFYREHGFDLQFKAINFDKGGKPVPPKQGILTKVRSGSGTVLRKVLPEPIFMKIRNLLFGPPAS